MLQFHNRNTHRRLKKGILIGALMLAISGAGVLGMNHTSYVCAKTEGKWSHEYNGYESSNEYFYTDANGWVFFMDSKTSQECTLEYVPEEVSGELVIPSKIRLDSIVRNVELNYYFVIPAGVTRISIPKGSEYSPEWFDNFDEKTKNNITVCCYEEDEISDYLKDNNFKTEILDPASAEAIGGEEPDNWTYDTELKRYIYTAENGISYGALEKDSDSCWVRAIPNDATGEITFSNKIMIDGKARTLTSFDDECKIPAGITKVTFTESNIYFTEHILEQCSPDLVLTFPLADSYSNGDEYSDDMYAYAKEKGLKTEFLNGMKDKNGVIYYIDNQSKKASAGVFVYEGKNTDVTVPSKVTINGTTYPVTRIAMSAFGGNQKLKKVTLPNSISIISGFAFGDCISLTTINLPSNLVEFYGSGVFGNCSSLTSIKIPSKVKYLPTELFAGCKKLKKVELPKNIAIGDGVFYECKVLSTIVNFDKVAEIGMNSFKGCKKLPSSLTFSNIQGIGWSAFEKCTSLKSVTINTKSLDYLEGSFYGCTSLKSVAINSKSIRFFNQSVFEGAKNLKNITIKATNLSAKNMGANIFKGTHKKLVVKVPAKKVSAYKKLFKKYGNKTITVKKL